MRFAILMTLLASTLATASGWRCSSNDERWTVTLYNHVDPYLGTTNPSKFTVTEDGHTLVHRVSPQIDFVTTSKGTTYRTTDSENVYACVVNFHVGFREGVDSIPSGAKRTGRLYFTQCGGSEEEPNIKLDCRRYLKNP